MSDLPEVQRARPVVSLVILVVLGVINALLFLFLVPQCEQIYIESLAGTPLPTLTVFLMAFRIPLVCLAVAWPLAGIVAVWMRHRLTGWVVILGLWLFLAMIPFTLFALFGPILDGHAGRMADSSSATGPASDR